MWRPLVRLLRRRTRFDGLGLLGMILFSGVGVSMASGAIKEMIAGMLAVYVVLVGLMAASLRWHAANRPEECRMDAKGKRWWSVLVMPGVAGAAVLAFVGVCVVRETAGLPLIPTASAAVAASATEREAGSSGPAAARGGVTVRDMERRERLEMELRLMGSAVMASELGEVHRWLAAGPVVGPTLLPTDGVPGGASGGVAEMAVGEPSAGAAPGASAPPTPAVVAASSPPSPASAPTAPPTFRSMSMVNVTLQWAVVQSAGKSGPMADEHLAWFGGWLRSGPQEVAVASHGECRRVWGNLSVLNNGMRWGMQGFRVSGPEVSSAYYDEAAEWLAWYISADAGEPLERLADATGRTTGADGLVTLPRWRGHEVDPLLDAGIAAKELAAAELRVLERLVWVMPPEESDRGKRAVAALQRWLSRLEREQLEAPERRRLVLLRRMVGG